MVPGPHAGSATVKQQNHPLMICWSCCTLGWSAEAVPQVQQGDADLGIVGLSRCMGKEGPTVPGPLGYSKEMLIVTHNWVCRYMDEEDPKAADGQADLPEERLAFALGDGRVGVLAVKGRKVLSPLPFHPGSRTRGQIAGSLLEIGLCGAAMHLTSHRCTNFLPCYPV